MQDIKRFRLTIRSIIILLISMVILLMMMAMVVQEPPLEKFAEYERILASVPGIRENDMDRQKYLVAEHFRSAAISEWQVQESRWLYLRNYNEVRRMMNLAISIVEEISSEQASSISASPAIGPPNNLTSDTTVKASSLH